MRFDTNNAGSFFVNQMEYADVVQSVQDEGDIMLLTLTSGERIMVHLVERNMTLSDLQYHLQTNTSNQLYTLMILWVDMFLPRDGSHFDLPDWAEALVSVQGDKVYGYEVAGRDAYFFPIHLEGTGQRRLARYGHVVDYAQIGCRVVTSKSPYISGTWRIADFEPRGQQTRSHTTDEIPRVDTALMEAFRILGVRSDAKLPIIKQTYRDLARLHHPDLNPTVSTHERMKQINKAYQYIVQALSARD